jgi:hypothetical protein
LHGECTIELLIKSNGLAGDDFFVSGDVFYSDDLVIDIKDGVLTNK